MKTEEITVRTKVNDVLDGQIRSVTLDAVSGETLVLSVTVDFPQSTAIGEISELKIFDYSGPLIKDGFTAIENTMYRMGVERLSSVTLRKISSKDVS